jgi:hypothetical protein
VVGQHLFPLLFSPQLATRNGPNDDGDPHCGHDRLLPDHGHLRHLLRRAQRWRCAMAGHCLLGRAGRADLAADLVRLHEIVLLRSDLRRLGSNSSLSVIINILQGICVLLVFGYACWILVLTVLRKAVFNLAEEQKIKLKEGFFSVNDVDLQKLAKHRSKYDYKLPVALQIRIPGSAALLILM